MNQAQHDLENKKTETFPTEQARVEAQQRDAANHSGSAKTATGPASTDAEYAANDDAPTTRANSMHDGPY